MASKLVIDLDTLTQEKAKTYAGMILVFAGFEDVDLPEIQLPAVIDPVAIFGPASQSGKVDERGPMLVIPQPPAQQIPPPPQPPAQQIPPPPAQTGIAIVTDTSGLPWDGRIHASSKATNTDGTWRFKRGVEKALVDNVTVELKRAMAAPGPHLVPPPPPTESTVPPPPAAEPSVDSRKMYVDLVGRAAASQGAGRITLDQVNKCLSALGVDNMPSLGHRLDLVPAACNLIDGIIAGTGA